MILIGIDPDIDKNGVAIKTDSYELLNLTFFELFDKLISLKNIDDLKVYVECGELNKTVYQVQNIPKGVRNIKVYCAQIGVKVGKNFSAANSIIQLCEYLGVEYVKVKPINRKLDKDQLKQYTGISKRTNQEQRDALMLIYGR